MICESFSRLSRSFSFGHHPLQHRSFAEALQQIETSFEFVETLHMAIRLGTLLIP